MSQAEAVLIGLFAVPVIVVMVLRVKATLVFLSLCLGDVLVQFLSSDAHSFTDMFVAHSAPSSNVLNIALLLAPAVLTVVFMVHSVKGSKLALNALPALATGALLAILVVPMLAADVSRPIEALPLWHQVSRLQDLIIGAGALVTLLLLWLQRPSRPPEKIGKHK